MESPSQGRTPSSVSRREAAYDFIEPRGAKVRKGVRRTLEDRFSAPDCRPRSRSTEAAVPAGEEVRPRHALSAWNSTISTTPKLGKRKLS